MTGTKHVISAYWDSTLLVSSQPSVEKAGDKIRTCDSLLGRQKLYQLSYTRI